MRTLISFLTCLFLTISMKAQTLLNIKDSTGRKQNEWVTFYDKKATKIKSQVYYVDGVRVGKAYFYAKSGRLKEVVYYDNNRIVLSKEFYTSEGKLGQVKTINGIKVKPTISKLVYQVDSSSIQTSFTNRIDNNGNKYGFWYEVVLASFFNLPYYREYYVVGSYQNGLREGNAKYYNYDTRELVYDINYKSGILNGVFNIYDRNGSVSVIYHYENGKRNGAYLAYFPKGNLRYKVTMKDDKLVGEYFAYDKNGKQIKYIKDAEATPPY
jgi:antitoxin component YwqK of YwqJK toxin-antitoxin module